MAKRQFRSLSRQSIANRPLRSKFKIFTDGVETEKNYFIDLNKIVPNIIDITAKNEDVDKLVNLAIAYKQSEQYDGEYDEVCIVCDIDERLKSRKSAISLKNAILLAKQNGINIYLSNESFEVWILAHFGPVPSEAQNRTKASHLLKSMKVMTGAKSKRLLEKYLTAESVKTAIKNCKSLRNAYNCEGDILNASGPATDVDKLVKALNTLPKNIERN